MLRRLFAAAGPIWTGATTRDPARWAVTMESASPPVLLSGLLSDESVRSQSSLSQPTSAVSAFASPSRSRSSQNASPMASAGVIAQSVTACRPFFIFKVSNPGHLPLGGCRVVLRYSRLSRRWPVTCPNENTGNRHPADQISDLRQQIALLWHPWPSRQPTCVQPGSPRRLPSTSRAATSPTLHTTGSRGRQPQP